MKAETIKAEDRPALRVNVRKVVIVLVALSLFILAIQLLKSGAKELVPFVRGYAVHNPVNALGLGWLAAYIVLSGSPVAAISLSLLDAGALDQLSSFWMIVGSRMGAAFIVLAVGFVYALRGHDRRNSLRMGLLALLTTFAIQLPALLIGFGLLNARVLDWFHLSATSRLLSVLDLVMDPVIQAIESWLPRWTIFGLGFGVLWWSMNLLDHGMPNFHLEESAERRHPRWLTHPLAAFGLGLAVTSVTMSVSVSLSILVPLAVRGYLRRGNVIPYIMGANITTFVDTLVVAILLNNPGATVVVLAEMLSIALISILILLLVYRPFENSLLSLTDHIGGSNRTLALFLAVIVGVPVALLLIR
jgi:Na+/phosphate symporter